MKPSECVPGARIMYQPRWANGETVRAVIEKEQIPLLTYLVRIVHPIEKPHGIDTDLVAIGAMTADIDSEIAWAATRFAPPEQAPTADDARAEPDHKPTWRPKGGFNRDNTSDEQLLAEDTVPNDEWDRIQKEHSKLHSEQKRLAQILQSNAGDVLVGMGLNQEDCLIRLWEMEDAHYKLHKLARSAFWHILRPPKD